MQKSIAWKRYNHRLIWLSLAYAVFLIVAVYGFKHKLFAVPGAYVAAVLPALPIIGMFAALGRYLVEEEDEYVRMLMVRQTLWASGFTLALATIWGFLDNFNLVGHIDGYWVMVTWWFGLAIGSLANKYTLGDSGGC